MSKSGNKTPADLFTPKEPELLSLFAEGELEEVVGAMPRKTAHKQEFVAPHAYYSLLRDDAIRELEKVYDDTSSLDVRMLLRTFTKTLYRAYVRREDPRQLYANFIEGLKQGDFVDHNRRLDMTLRSIKLRQKAIEERLEREANLPAESQGNGLVEGVEWYRQLPTWAEIYGKAYRPRNAFSGNSEAYANTPDPITHEYLASVTARYEKGINPERVIDVKDEKAADPDLYWFRVNVLASGVLCIDEMCRDQVFDYEVKEGVKPFQAVRELQQRLAQVALEPEADPGEEETLAVADLEYATGMFAAHETLQ